MLKDILKDRTDYRMINIIAYSKTNPIALVRTTKAEYVVDHSNIVNEYDIEDALILIDCLIPGSTSMLNRVVINRTYIVSVEELYNG